MTQRPPAATSVFQYHPKKLTKSRGSQSSHIMGDVGHGRCREENQRRRLYQKLQIFLHIPIIGGLAGRAVRAAEAVRVCLRGLREYLKFNCTAAHEFYAVCIVGYNRAARSSEWLRENIYDPDGDAKQSTPIVRRSVRRNPGFGAGESG